MKLIVGLGNPGREYQKNRHNIGFTVTDELIQVLGFEKSRYEEKFKAEISAGSYKGQKLFIAKPQTFMNLSGEAVAKLTQFYKILPEDILIIYDDLDLSLGQIRIRKSGSAGTHNGMKSVVENLQTLHIPRLRVGVESRGETAPKEQETVSFVLENFLKSEQPLLTETIKKSIEAIKSVLEENIQEAMNQYNS